MEIDISGFTDGLDDAAQLLDVFSVGVQGVTQLVEGLQGALAAVDWQALGGATAASGESQTSELMTGATDGITGGQEALVAATQAAADAALAALETTLATEAGNTITTAFMQGGIDGTNAQEPVLTDATQLAADNSLAALLGTLTTDAGNTVASDFFQGAIDAVAAQDPILMAVVKTAADNGLSAISGTLTYDAGYAIGRNMMEGAAEGVRSGSGSLASAVRSAASSAVSAMKRALKIHSPSGVFADEVGAFIPSGVGLGIERNERDALGPLEEMRESMLGLFDDTGFDIPWPSRSGTGPSGPYGRSPYGWQANGRDGGMVVNIYGDWHVRSDEDRETILDELYERIRRERGR